MTATYAGLVRSLETADDSGRALMVRLASGGSGRLSLAVYMASQGTTPVDAAAAIGCEVAELDREVQAFAESIRHEAARLRKARTP